MPLFPNMERKIRYRSLTMEFDTFNAYENAWY
jgi:hypothetical protein